jgi:hypothetical protein
MKSQLLFLSTWLSVACLVLCHSSVTAEVPAWVVYPDEDWRTLSPEEAGIRDVAAWNRWVEATRKTAKGASFQGEDHRGSDFEKGRPLYKRFMPVMQHVARAG